eukprot:COSAG02_NODE_197_length_29578_cov_9.718647_12_plen_57_part_00
MPVRTQLSEKLTLRASGEQIVSHTRIDMDIRLVEAALQFDKPVYNREGSLNPPHSQ